MIYNFKPKINTTKSQCWCIWKWTASLNYSIYILLHLVNSLFDDNTVWWLNTLSSLQFDSIQFLRPYGKSLWSYPLSHNGSSWPRFFSIMLLDIVPSNLSLSSSLSPSISSCCHGDKRIKKNLALIFAPSHVYTSPFRMGKDVLSAPGWIWYPWKSKGVKIVFPSWKWRDPRFLLSQETEIPAQTVLVMLQSTSCDRTGSIIRDAGRVLVDTNRSVAWWRSIVAWVTIPVVPPLGSGHFFIRRRLVSSESRTEFWEGNAHIFPREDCL